MTRRQRWIVGLSAAAVIAVMSLPLALVLPMALPEESGISARRAEGSVWNGTVREVSVAGLPMGDARVGLHLLPLFIGEARLGFTAPALRGTLSASGSTLDLSDASGTIDLAGRFRPLPLSRLNLDGATSTFRDERCVTARGRVRADVAGEVAGLALPGGMSGALRCDGAMLHLPLVGQSGMERIDLRIAQSGKWGADLSVRSTDPALSARLLAAGFSSGPGGYSIRVEGAL